MGIRNEVDIAMGRTGSGRDDAVQDLLKTLVDGLAKPEIQTTKVIPWACPVPFFGDLEASRVATVGINPSNLEFQDNGGCELNESDRRFHTLASLGLRTWKDVNARHLRKIAASCREYFQKNPYDDWFATLNELVAGAGMSFYPDRGRVPACHLDLVPYSTFDKWRNLDSSQRRALLDLVPDCLGRLVRDSPVRVLILNGRTVVDEIQKSAEGRLKSRKIPSWSLPYASGPRYGYAYWGDIDTLSGVELRRTVKVLGYSHNLQGTFGMRSDVTASISNWISRRIAP